MKDQKKAEEIAQKRVELILPLIEKGIGPALAREKYLQRKWVIRKNTQALSGPVP